MEMSSPALNLHLVYRNLAGEKAQKITAASVKCFALLFFIFRIIIYGFAVVWLCYILMTQVSFMLSALRMHAAAAFGRYHEEKRST